MKNVVYVIIGEWKTIEEPTLDKEGKEERNCKICNEKETRSIAKLESKGCKGNVTIFPFLFCFILALFVLKKKYN